MPIKSSIYWFPIRVFHLFDQYIFIDRLILPLVPVFYLQQVVPNFVIGCSLIGCTSSSLIG
ncbi:hypothetical protein T08_8880 [Trichinella sp. T8]|nr:hypothetical protein T08_8880 [Trichinella sp. T8]